MMLLINRLCTMMWFYLEGKSCICLFLFSTFIVSITFKARNLSKEPKNLHFFPTSCNDNKVIHSFLKGILPSLRDRDMSKA